MATTSFSGPVRSENGFQTVTKNETTGDLTITASIGTGASPPNMVPGSGITGTGTVYASSVVRNGSLIETKIVMNITGLNGGNAANDIIGADGQPNCHIGQVLTAVNGVIFAGSMRCLQVPTGSNADIDLYAADVATGAEDELVTSLAGQAILLNAGTWTLGQDQPLTAYPGANRYLYLANGTATAGTFTAGRLEIILYGRAA